MPEYVQGFYVLLLLIGALIAILGILIFIFKKRSGENNIEIFTWKFKISDASLVIVVMGCVLMILAGIKVGDAHAAEKQVAKNTTSDEPDPVKGEKNLYIEPAPTKQSILPVEPGSNEVSSSTRANLVSAIRLAIAAEIKAFENLDATNLENSHLSDELRRVTDQIITLKNNGRYLVSQLHDLQFENFTVSADGQQAEVKVVGALNGTAYSIYDNECLGKIPYYKAIQTIHLQLTERGWMVSLVVQESAAPAPEPC